MAAMKESTKTIIKFLQDNADEWFTAKDLAEKIPGTTARQINGVFTTAVQRKGLGSRVEREVELEDKTHEKVKFLRLNEAGIALDLDAEAEKE